MPALSWECLHRGYISNTIISLNITREISKLDVCACQVTSISPFQVPGLSSPVYKEYHRTLIQERDRDMTGDRSYDDEYNLFSCLSRLVSTHLSTLSRKLNYLTCLVEHDINSTKDRIPMERHKLNICTFLLRNPWLPGWILTTTLILSVLVLIWICCATVATAVDQYVPAEVSFWRFLPVWLRYKLNLGM